MIFIEMKTSFKYIVVDSGVILFNEQIVHSEVAKNFKKVYSAGFVTLIIGESGKIEAKTSGRSESLKIGSIPEKDNWVIDDIFFKTMSQIKYLNFSIKDFYKK
jgi:hypothetical protein